MPRPDPIALRAGGAVRPIAKRRAGFSAERPRSGGFRDLGFHGPVPLRGFVFFALTELRPMHRASPAIAAPESIQMIGVCDRASPSAIRHSASNPAVPRGPSDQETLGGIFPIPRASSARSVRPFVAENWSDESHDRQGLRTESGTEPGVRPPARR